MRIGVFDSGVGGVTVLKELMIRFPEHEFSYFGDTANVPYGTKSSAQIRQLVTDAATRMQTRNLDALVIACNTASSIAFAEFKATLAPMPLIDVVAAGVRSIRKAALHLNNPPVLILGTRATVKSKIYSRLLAEGSPLLQVSEQACPLLVPLIEEGWLEHPVLDQVIEEYVRPYQALSPGIALLACTHYPWISKAIQANLPGWTVIDSAHAVAEIIAEALQIEAKPSQDSAPTLSWFFSDPDSVSPKVIQFGKNLPQSF